MISEYYVIDYILWYTWRPDGQLLADDILNGFLWKKIYFDKKFTRILSTTKPLVQVIAWHTIANKLLPEEMLNKVSDAIFSHSADMS